MSSCQQSYTVQQKLEAVKYPESHNVSETAKAHNLGPKQIREWKEEGRIG